jgi:hypothetical protein
VFVENSTFNRNATDSTSFIDDTGLIIITTGDVALDNVQANQNRLIGADIHADGQVDIRNSSFDENFGAIMDASGAETFWGCGLQVGGVPVGGIEVGVIQDCNPQNLSAAIVNLNTVTANGNYLYGADLSANGDVNISNSSFSNNATPADQANAQGGLMVQSGGFVDLDTITVNDNGMFGATIVADDDIDIKNSVFNNNLKGAGLTAFTLNGVINLTDVIALGNGGDGANLETNCDVFVYATKTDGSVFGGNTQYGINATASSLNLNLGFPTTFTPANGVGPTFVTAPSGNCPTSGGGVVVVTSPGPQYIVTSLTEGQLPGAIGVGNAFVSALQVSSTAANFEFTLSFPIPAGMENANLSVMVWDGSEWVAVPGGSVIGNEFVITVTQPGVYVLVSQ